MTDADDDTPGFVTLDGYSVPSAEATGLLRSTWVRIRENLGWEKPRANLFEDLRSIDAESLDNLMARPRHDSLNRRLDSAIGRWLTDSRQPQTTQIIVYPPTNSGDFLRSWASRHDLHVIPAPERRTDLPSVSDTLDMISKPGLVVVPDLQRYFLREVGGMEAVKTLLLTVAQSPYPAILGCNSWAWQFLIKAVNAHHLLPKALVPQAYSAARLNSWLKSISIDSGLPVHSLKTGGDIFAGKEPSVEVKQIAYRSRGVPWVAWELWRQSLFMRDGEGEKIIWVDIQPEETLVDTDEKACLLILHSLLIHGELDKSELSRTLPRLDISSHVGMLVRQEWVKDADGRLTVRGDAYPRVRNALAVANYPMDGL